MTNASVRGRPNRALPAAPGFRNNVCSRHSTTALPAVAADHQVVALGHRVVPAHEALADAAQQDAQAERLDLGLPRQVVLPVRQVGVAEHRRDGAERPETREHVERADVAGVDDALGAGEQLVQPRVVVAVRRWHTDEGRTEASVMRIGYRQWRTTAAGMRRAEMKGLAGKRVVVTGGTSGIGAATVQRFRDEGCEVVVLARPPGPGVIPCDVSDRAQVEAAFAEMGALGVITANAGISERSPAADIGPEQWDHVVGTNLSGALWTAQAAAAEDAPGGRRLHRLHGLHQRARRLPLLRRLQRVQGGSGGARPLAGAQVGALRARQRRLPRLCADADAGVGVHAQDARPVNERIPLGRHATPEELAGLFAYLASDEAAYFTGSVIVMDGGETAGSVVSGPGRPGADRAGGGEPALVRYARGHRRPRRQHRARLRRTGAVLDRRHLRKGPC